ncbi:extracellular solute-binding protein [Vibrio sp. SCSIO 43136]|uniref:ABC transporter substrate-binding protein n=1 Tax=Vibrio sp. SCSIO 43136 TaxID=2819101 RepID=UPI002075BFC9|nr:extracellular solute-binding protein [Vibrio sp. SCSIO 43136]USD65247.1 extracellular solute-binding protein [Vibrio sp. SCSIO 43136]
MSIQTRICQAISASICTLIVQSSVMAATLPDDHEQIIQQELAQRPSYFDIKDIPEITDKRPIRIVVERGLGKRLLAPYIIPKFSEKTGIEVEVIELTLEQMLKEQRTSVVNLQSQYDMISIEGSWLKGWADQSLVYSLSALAKRFDSVSSFSAHTSYFYSSLLTMMSYEQELYALPYSNYTMVNHYRHDLFEHPSEQQTFLAQYGYPLAPPNDVQQLLDVAEFFTRSKGSALAGETLSEDFYGVTLMAGYAPHVGDEFSTLIWGLKGQWFKPAYHNNLNSIHGFYIDDANPEFLQTAEIYKQLLKFAPPQALSSSWREGSQQFRHGKTAMYPFSYNNVWALNAQVETLVPGAKIAAAQVPLGQPYFGGWGIAIPIDARNVEGAYWLSKYMTSFEAQFANTLTAGSPCRIDVATHEFFARPEQHLNGGALNQGHIALTAWRDNWQDKGHYTSIAMQHIYDVIQETSYSVASQRLAPEFALSSANKKIKELHNRHGRSPFKVAPLEGFAQ